MNDDQPIARLAARLDPHLTSDGFVRVPSEAGSLVWEKPGEYAKAGEVDRLELHVRVDVADPPRGHVSGRCHSWMGEDGENIRQLAIAYRGPGTPPAPEGWDFHDHATLVAAVDDIEALVAGQAIGWFDEPVPLVPARSAPVLDVTGLVLGSGDT